jgi:asparagine synthase (glutamine-hydrolysing)
MCGIAGILTASEERDLKVPLARMLRALRHRGPDDEDLIDARLPGGHRLGLAHTRLSILDLGPTGHQPMYDPPSGSWITYNGEAYNHQAVRGQLGDCTFRSSGDTETILQGWVRLGPDVLALLRGMFAFALYDGARRQLWLVRDRLGIKPLYVSRTDADTWVFASELRALLASGLVARRLNAAAVDSYLAFGAVPAPWTLLADVQSLVPGECWRFALTRPDGHRVPERVRYWRPPFGRLTGPPLSHAEAAERLRPALLEAVGLRMVSDVPVGVFLSGGVDSSSVVAALACQGHRLHTFSVAFGEHDYDESRHAREVARHFGTEHTELLLSPRRVLDEFEQALAAYDQPSIDGVNTYFISQATRQGGVKVALSGVGGDELFAGYASFRWLARMEQPWPRQIARLVHGVLRYVAPRSTRTQKLGAILHSNGARLANYSICRQLLARRHREALFPCYQNGAHEPLPTEVREELAEGIEELDSVNAHSLLELSLYLANMLLRDTDQMSMAHALEVREPLLDHRLVEELACLPGPLKLAWGRQNRTKALLVDALPTALPNGLLRRPKMGFVLPWERWLRHELRDWVDDLLARADVLEAAGLAGPRVHALWADFLARRPGVRYTDILCFVHLVAWVARHRTCLVRIG